MNPELESSSGARRRRRLPRAARIPLIALGAVVLFVALGFLLQWLWSVTVSDIFGWKPISFWQAWGLILLSQILFKANLSSGASSSSSKRRERGPRPQPKSQPETGGAA